MSELVKIVVSAQDDANLAAVVQRLCHAGMDVEDVMEEVGVVSGSIVREQLSALSALEGVAHVEESRKFQLPPPDSEIQ